MMTVLTPAGMSALLTSGAAPAFTLWFKSSHGRGSWEPVAAGPTEREAIGNIGCGNRHGGKWLILPAGRQP